MALANHQFFTNFVNFGDFIFSILCNFLAFSPFLCLNFSRLKIDRLGKRRNSIEFVIPANPGSGPGQAPESRVPGENRDPIFGMVPDFPRDDVWTPAPGLKTAGTSFAGVTLQETFYKIIRP